MNEIRRDITKKVEKKREERHIMLDLETLGTASNSVIISIGAIAFYPYKLIDDTKTTDHADTTTSFFCAVDAISCKDIGLKVNEETVAWWGKQSEEAHSQFINPISIFEALTKLTALIEPCDALWGNGSDFDNVILANAYKACGFDQPWSHRNNRCYRTMKAMFPYIKTTRYELKHNALQDAKYQTRHLLNIIREIYQ